MKRKKALEREREAIEAARAVSPRKPKGTPGAGQFRKRAEIDRERQDYLNMAEMFGGRAETLRRKEREKEKRKEKRKKAEKPPASPPAKKEKSKPPPKPNNDDPSRSKGWVSLEDPGLAAVVLEGGAVDGWTLEFTDEASNWFGPITWGGDIVPGEVEAALNEAVETEARWARWSLKPEQKPSPSPRADTPAGWVSVDPSRGRYIVPGRGYVTAPGVVTKDLPRASVAVPGAVVVPAQDGTTYEIRLGSARVGVDTPLESSRSSAASSAVIRAWMASELVAKGRIDQATARSVFPTTAPHVLRGRAAEVRKGRG